MTNLLPQNVYRLTTQGIAQVKLELDIYESDTIRVGAMCFVCDEWSIEIIDIEEDGTVVIHDIDNFLNETFASKEYLAMVKHEPHLVELIDIPVLALDNEPTKDTVCTMSRFVSLCVMNDRLHGFDLGTVGVKAHLESKWLEMTFDELLDEMDVLEPIPF
jgi:hypothetical protein